jgi:GH35 family endo-1,4-beta-xylanase
MSGTPRWVLKMSKEMSSDLYRARIQNLVAGFKDQIKMWDVVNEPVTTVPWEKAMEDTAFGASLIDEGSRYNVTGITLEQTIPWVENSYRWAFQANPKGDFHINEFYIIAKPDIREKYFQLVKEMQRRNVPLNGIGIQAHEPREMWFSPTEIVATFDKFQQLGLPLHITEFIPQSSGKNITGGWREGVWTEEAQAEFSEQFYTLAFGHPAMTSIHWWGLSDRMIWLKGGGLLDKDFNPKPVYTRLHKLIKQDWMTKNVVLKTDKTGTIKFRGFYGKYQIRVTAPDGKIQVFETHLAEKADNQWVFKLQ